MIFERFTVVAFKVAFTRIQCEARSHSSHSVGTPVACCDPDLMTTVLLVCQAFMNALSSALLMLCPFTSFLQQVAGQLWLGTL